MYTKFKTFIENKNPGMTREEWEAFGVKMGWMRAKREHLPKREPGSLNWEAHGTFDFNSGEGIFQYVQANDRYYEIMALRANRNHYKQIEDINGIAHDGFKIYVTEWDGKKPIMKTRKQIAKIEDKENNGTFSQLRMKRLYEKEVVPFITKHFANIS